MQLTIFDSQAPAPAQEKQQQNPIRFRIQKADGCFLNAGTGKPSWHTLQQARQLVNYEDGQRIIESDGVNILWEIF